MALKALRAADLRPVAACCTGTLRHVGGRLSGLVVRALGVADPRPVGPRSGAEALGTGVALRGRLWLGGEVEPWADGVLVLDHRGVVRAAGPYGALPLPEGLRVIGGPQSWVGPGLVDAHVHLAFGRPQEQLVGGLVGVRDLGAPPGVAVRTGPEDPPVGSPVVCGSGPILTAPGGYPSTSWGADGFARFVEGPGPAGAAVARLARDGVQLIKIALEPAGGPVPSRETVRAVVDAAHGAGLPVTAHALTRSMVALALDAGVDELAHTPVEPLGEELVTRIAERDVAVVSTLQTFFAQGQGPTAAANAAQLHRAGVRLVYGTDLGNAGTRSGIDPRELDRLADAGLGRLGALRAATVGAAGAAGMVGRTGRLTVGAPAAAVLLDHDPLVDPQAWRTPRAVVADGRLLQPSG